MRCKLATILCLSFVATDGSARFIESDADRIDPEERYGTETYNDKLSYRFPVVYDRLWDAHDVGWRVSAGSLDIRRFDYVEDWKLAAGADGPVAVAATQSRREDTLDARTERTVRIEGRVVGPWRLFVLGDGGVFKEYGDVGGGLAYRESRDRDVRVQYWSVDHYYETKKVESEDERTRKPDSLGAEARWTFGGLAVEAEAEADHPLRWSRPSQGYVYEYERRTYEYRFSMPVASDASVIVTGRHERKYESKDWTSQSKSLRRAVDQVEASAVRMRGQETIAGGLVLIRRDADYSFIADHGLDESAYVEAPGPERSHRREGAVYGTWHFPYGGPRSFVQLGAHLNQVRLDEDGVRRATELKNQVAWDYALTDTARLSLNTTWDLDQLQKDFPYDRRPFRPWGGGNIQILAVF